MSSSAFLRGAATRVLHACKSVAQGAPCRISSPGTALGLRLTSSVPFFPAVPFTCLKKGGSFSSQLLACPVLFKGNRKTLNPGKDHGSWSLWYSSRSTEAEALSKPVEAPSRGVVATAPIVPGATEAIDAMAHRGGASQSILTRYPDFTSRGILRGLDYLGTCVFAASGSLAAAASGMDLVGGGLVGFITAVGGGTARDVIVGQHPVFWLVETEYMAMAVATAVMTYLAAPYASELWPPGSLTSQAFETFMKWGDAVGIATFAIIGCHCGIQRAMPLGACILFGLMTSTFGGMARDVVCYRPVKILNHNRDAYATVALTCASVYVALTISGFSQAVRIALTTVTSFAGRYMANLRDPKGPEHQNR